MWYQYIGAQLNGRWCCDPMIKARSDRMSVMLEYHSLFVIVYRKPYSDLAFFSEWFSSIEGCVICRIAQNWQKYCNKLMVLLHVKDICSLLAFLNIYNLFSLLNYSVTGVQLVSLLTRKFCFLLAGGTKCVFCNNGKMKLETGLVDCKVCKGAGNSFWYSFLSYYPWIWSFQDIVTLALWWIVIYHSSKCMTDGH